MRKKFALLSFLILSLTVLQPALAKAHKHAHVRGIVVSSVDVIEKKIVLMVEHNKQSLPYGLPLGTTITINGESASLGQILPGMHVISYTEADEHVLSQLDVESKTGK